MNAGAPPESVYAIVALPPSPGGGQDGSWVTWQNLRDCALSGG